MKIEWQWWSKVDVFQWLLDPVDENTPSTTLEMTTSWWLIFVKSEIVPRRHWLEINPPNPPWQLTGNVQGCNQASYWMYFKSQRQLFWDWQE